MRILVLYSDTGGGHRASAKALQEALHALDPAAEVKLADPLMEHGPAMLRRLTSLYSPLIRRSRPVWGAVYHGANLRPAFAALRGIFGPQLRRVIMHQLREHDPDLVLSVHPLVNHVAWAAIQRSGRRRGLMVVVTDLVEFHRGWAFPRADLVVVPTEAAAKAVRKWRVPAERVKLFGLPVSLRFRPPAPGERQAFRRAFGLEEDRFTVLVSGGGEGSGGLLKLVRALAWRQHPWQVLVVCGRNDKLRRRLGRLQFGTGTRILGFVDNMPELMRAADLVVTKAGPGAIGEALATGLPLVITSYLPGQETANVEFVRKSGIGTYAPQPAALLEAVSHLASDNAAPARAMAERATAMSHPYASLDIAREALEIASRYKESGQLIR